MMYKILLLFYVATILVSIKGLFKKTNIEGVVREQIESKGKEVMTVSYMVMSLIISIPLIVFYVQSYSLSPLLQWLSALQVIFALRAGWVCATLVQRIENGSYSVNNLKRFVMCAFDIVYLYFVIMAIV